MDDEKYSDEDLLFMCAEYIHANYNAMLELNDWSDDIYGIEIGFLAMPLEEWNDDPTWALIRERHPDLARYIEILVNRNPYLMHTLRWLFLMRALNPFISTVERLENIGEKRMIHSYSPPRFFDQTKVSINKITKQKQYEPMTKLNKYIESIELSLFERITRLILEDASIQPQIEKLLDRRIPILDLLKIIRYMSGHGKTYKIGETEEEQLLARLLLDLTRLHSRGHTFRDFISGAADRDMLQLFRRLAKHNLIQLDEVEQVFEELDNEDITELINTLENLAQNGMTEEEFKYGSGPVWNTLTPEQVALIRKSYKRYGARADVSSYIEQVFQRVLEMYKNRLLQMIPNMVHQGIDYTRFLFGSHVPSINLLNRVRHVPRILNELQDAFVAAENFVTEEVLAYIHQMIVHNPGLTYQELINGNADITFMSAQDRNRFIHIYQLIENFANYSDIQKRIRRLF